MQSTKRRLLYKFLIIFSVMFTVVLFNFIHDPCMVFRQRNDEFLIHEYRTRSTYNKALYGIYETAIVGSCTSLKSTELMVDEIFKGANSRNLAVYGTTSYITHAIIKRAIDKKDTKRIIYGYDLFDYNKEEILKSKKDYQPNIGIFDKIKYLLDLKLSITQIQSATENCSESKKDKSSPTTLGARVKKIFSDYYHIAPPYLTKKRRNIENVGLLANIIRENPQIHFDIYFTPYNILWWYKLSKINELDNYLEVKRETIKRLLPLKNVSLYDFQDSDEIIFDMSSFNDDIHYASNINEKVLNYIKKNKCRLIHNASIYSFENSLYSKIERFEKEYAQTLIDYKCEQELKLIKKQIDIKRKIPIHQ